MSQLNLQQTKVAVIGAGTMGIGIAQLAAMHGHQTYLFDVDAEKSKIAVAQLADQLAKRVQAGKMAQQLVDSTLANLSIATAIEQLAETDLIVEAIVEKKEVKQQLFQQLAAICSPQTIFASNTSSISITAIASIIPHPERVVGLHFFNPAPVMKLVEIIRGLKTSAEIATALTELMHLWKKVPVTAKSTPGFIVNRVARPYYAEAFRALQENVISPEQLDFILRECGRFAMGPCELTDLIGQDVNFSVTKSVYQEFFYEPRYRPSLIQKELVDAGCYGRKSGQGFYHYAQAEKTPQYRLPQMEKSEQQLAVQIKGAWLNLPAFIQRIQHAERIDANCVADQRDVIQMGEVTLKVTQGESVDLSYAQEKIVLMDWHADWSKAKAIALVASTACTDQDKAQVAAFFQAMDMIPIWSQDHPGLYVMRTIAMLVNEACEAVLHAIASEQHIDAAMKYGVNYPKGPFEWAESIGYNTILQILENLYHIYAEEKYRPSLYLRKKVALGQTPQQQDLQYRQAG